MQSHLDEEEGQCPQQGETDEGPASRKTVSYHPADDVSWELNNSHQKVV